MKKSPDILIVGSNGFLGSTLVRELGADAADRTQIDLTRLTASSVNEVLGRRYSHVAITAAATDIEFCFKNPVESRQINVVGTIELLKKIKAFGAIPIFFSTDYVFTPKSTPHREEDEKIPVTLYGKQKLEVEKFMEQNFEKFLIFRTSKLMSKNSHSKNILKPVVENLARKTPIKLFEDQWLNPVFTEDIARVVKRSMEAGLSGVFHLGTKNMYTRAGLARCVAGYFGFDTQLIQSGYMKDIVTSEPRPNHNTLNCEKIENALDFQFTEVVGGLAKLGEELKVEGSSLQFVNFQEKVHLDLVRPLTELLHEAYAPLAARGMRYLATHQPPEKTLERLREGESYLAFYDGELVGTVTLYREKADSSCEYYRNSGVFSFGQFAIKRVFQGRGFGSLMMDMLESRSKELGARELALDTSEHADNLIAMYEKRGYQIVTHTKWEVTNYRSVIMRKVLI